MAINETISTGNKYRRLKDASTKLWQRISFWTKASDVEFDNGMTVEASLGSIQGITDSVTSTSSNIAASAKAVQTLNNSLSSFQTGVDSLYDQISSLGVTPKKKTLASITAAISKLYEYAYKKGGGSLIGGTIATSTICDAVGAGARYSKTDSNDAGSSSDDYDTTFSIPLKYNGGTLYRLVGRFNGSAYSYGAGGSAGASGNGSYTLKNASGTTITTNSYTSQGGSYNQDIYTDFSVDFLEVPYEVSGDALSLQVVAHANASCGTSVGALALAKAEFTFTAKYKIPSD